MAVAKAYGINTYTWKEGKMGEDNLMDCLNFVYNVLRDAGYLMKTGTKFHVLEQITCTNKQPF